MKKFRKHLNEMLKNPEFKREFEQEKLLVGLALEINAKRQKLGLSQGDLAKKANLTQQQISKVENGLNCNIVTFIKVSKALGLKLSIK